MTLVRAGVTVGTGACGTGRKLETLGGGMNMLV